MSISLKTTSWTLLVFILFLSFVTGCKKEFAIETPLPVSEREITLNEVKTRYGTPSKDGTGDRTGAKLPLGVIPKWEGAYVVRTNQFPIILTTVEAPCACPGTDFGGNLGFYKDGFGTIKSVFITWKADPTSPYKAEKAPLDSATHFSGMMVLVNEQDTIEKIAQIQNGRITEAKTGKLAFPDLASLGAQGDGGVESRDPWDWWRRLWGGVTCPNPNGGGGGMNWDWWNNFWGWLGSAFSNLWDTEGGEHFSWPAGSFFFGNVEGGWNITWPTGPDYNQPGGSGIFDQQFAAQMTTCQAIREYIESIGDIPPNYSSTDLEFCQLISELGTDGDENMCLFRQYGTTEIGDLWDYWNSTDKSVESAERVKDFIRARCAGSTSAVLVDMLKQNFCISQYPADLMEDIRENCGFSSYDSPEWEGNFNNGLSDCVKEAILDDWFDLSGTEKSHVLNTPSLSDQIFNFVLSNGCSTQAKEFAEYAISLLPDHTDYKWERLQEVYNLVKGNNNALVGGCDPHYSYWSDLASFVPSGVALARIQNSNGTWNVQDIQDASGARVNLDEFSISVQSLPFVSGSQLSSKQLLEHIRKNINDFAPKFTPYDIPYDENLWNSSNPLGTVFQIEMAPGVDGDVIASQYEECCWIFTSLRGPVYASGYHPISGNRQFGYRVTSSGVEFYTKGADRATTWYHGLGDSNIGFSMADALWTNFQNNIIQYVNSHGGNAPSATTIINRPNWDEVKEMLKSAAPITFIPCQ